MYQQTKIILEHLLRGIKNGKEYTIDLCANDINIIYSNQFSSDIFIYEKHIDKLLHLCCIEFNCTLEEIKGKSRKRNIVFARHIAMHILNNYKAGTLNTIGNLFGGRDHTTVLHACKNINNLISVKDDGYDNYLKIKNKFDEYLGIEKIEVTKDTKIEKPKLAFPIDLLDIDIDCKLKAIDSLKTKDKDVLNAIGIEKTTLQKVKIKIDELKELQ